MAAKAAGCETIIAVDIAESRLELATELGATHTINSRDGDLAERLREATSGVGLNFCLDTTGLPEVISDAFEALATRGRLGLVGVSAAVLHVVRKKRVIGTKIPGTSFLTVSIYYTVQW